MSSEPKKVDVLILGAGLSGLSAAFRLQERCPEMTFLIAEANDRFGGRTLSVDVKNPCNKEQTDTLDMGAHWVCERQKDIMQLMSVFFLVHIVTYVRLERKGSIKQHY